MDSGNTSPAPEESKVPPAVSTTARLDSGVGNSFSSRENTPRGNDEAQKEEGERKDDDKKVENENEGGDGEGDG